MSNPSDIKKIGVLTGGGDAPGLNAVVRAIVLSARREFGLQVVGIRDGFGGFVEADGTLPLTGPVVRGLLWRGGSILRCNNIYRGDPARFCEAMKELELDGLVVVGGDGSLTIGAEMAKLGARIVGVPKTIDRDVVGTDTTFGFDSALAVVSDACQRLIDTAESHHRVMIVEVMGRNSGFIALHGAVAGGADVALVPEIPYRVENIADVVQARCAKNRTYTLIVAAEGAAPAGGDQVTQGSDHGRVRLGGIAEALTGQLAAILPHQVRSVTLGHLQRGGTPTPFDRVLGTRMGTAAVAALMAGESGVFTALRDSEIVLTPIEVAAGKQRTLQQDDPTIATARSVGISFGD
ncbi:MAG: ATP-dependent 6-phosphofructokinase [Planctomycetota bacterium]